MKTLVQKTAFLLPALAILSISSASAATLVNYSAAGSNAPATNLSTQGTVTWAAWDYGDNPANAASFVPSATKAGGQGTVGAMTRIGGVGSNLRGPTTDNSSTIFSWNTADSTGGVASPGDLRLSGLFSSTLQAQGQGVQFTLTGLAPIAAGQSPYVITVYGYSFGAQSQLTATTSSGGTSITQLSLNTTTAVRTAEAYQFIYNPDSSSDVLTISYAIFSATTANNSSAHAGLQAITVGIIPEPSALPLSVLGAAGFLLRRRQR